ncbi:Y-family DNA polymerase [Clostridium sp. C105KSO13]
MPAKKYGIRTGAPVANAFRKCLSLVMEPPDHKMYGKKSRALHI